jgi:hypothetical protein
MVAYRGHWALCNASHGGVVLRMFCFGSQGVTRVVSAGGDSINIDVLSRVYGDVSTG